MNTHATLTRREAQIAELFTPQAVVRPMRTRTSTSRTARRRELSNTYTIEL